MIGRLWRWEPSRLRTVANPEHEEVRERKIDDEAYQNRDRLSDQDWQQKDLRGKNQRRRIDDQPDNAGDDKGGVRAPAQFSPGLGGKCD